LHSQFLQISTVDKDIGGKMSCTFDPMLGVISFVPIQDHHPGLVIRTFEGVIPRVADGTITRDMIDRAIIQMTAKLDEPIAPTQSGMFDFFFNVSSTGQQERRELVFAITREELIDAAVKLRSSSKSYAILGVTQQLLIP
jgi:Zn-dependent M16 (insulinase) family peptidase